MGTIYNRKMKTYKLKFLILFLLVLAACDTTPEPIPTRVTSLDALATSEFMTANAPPEGYRGALAFPAVDEGLVDLPSWRSVTTMAFEGVFARTTREVDAEIRVQTWFTADGFERRVVVEGRGDLFGQEEGITIEGVRLGSDAFLVRDNVCVGQENAALVADLRAGSLIGGVSNAVPNGVNAIINGEQVWQYAFAPDDLVLPQVTFAEGGGMTDMRGELWFAPAREAVMRFYVTMQVENAIILLDDSETRLPVTGQLLIRYDLQDIGGDPNITQPFGC